MFRDLAAMIAAERDARKADVLDLRSRMRIIEAEVRMIDDRLALADDRTSGFEAAAIDTLGGMARQMDEFDDRLREVEGGRKDQAS